MFSPFRKGLWAAVLGLALAAPAQCKTPNIVFILTDDLDSAGAAQMTQLKALISDQGLNFRRHYVSLSLCCPSRVATLRGQFAHNTGVYSNQLPDGGFELAYAEGLENSTFATWLHDGGYRTGLFGKYLNGYPETAPAVTYIPPGWDEWFSPIAGDPHDGFNYVVNHNGVEEFFGSADTDYLTDVLSREAAQFIVDSVDQFPEKPFLLYLAPYTPHTPATPAPRHAKAFKNLKAPRTSSFNESDVNDKPSWVRSLPRLTSGQIKAIDKLYRKRRQTLLSIDELVQNIVNTLSAKGELENTFIMFTSDNGYHQGQHRMDSGKNTGFEEDIAIPLMVRGPGVPQGQTVFGLTANVDYASTFADIAALPIPSFVDGRSFKPFLQGQFPSDWRQALLLEHKSGSSSTIAGVKGTREVADPWDLIHVTGSGANGFVGLRVSDGTSYLEYETGEFELYNNFSDSAQLTNAYNFTPPSTRLRLNAWLNTLKNASGQALRDAEVSPP
jgi:N-acetylglucosamine-6-sulfatase